MFIYVLKVIYCKEKFAASFWTHKTDISNYERKINGN